jgi:hypothetical protein
LTGTAATMLHLTYRKVAAHVTRSTPRSQVTIAPFSYFGQLRSCIRFKNITTKFTVFMSCGTFCYSVKLRSTVESASGIVFYMIDG